MKRVYFTGVYMCDQGLIDSLCFTNIAQDNMKKDFPNLKELYAKSNNASSHRGNFYIEDLYQLCHERQIKLRRYMPLQ